MTSACSHFTDRLDALLDGDLSPEEARAAEEHAASCPACAAELALAHRITQRLPTLATPECPDDVFDGALERIRHLERDRAAVHPASEQHRRFRRWRAASLVAVGALALALGSLFVLDRPAEPEFSAAEIAQARHDLEFALGLVGEAGREAGVFIQEDVIERRIVGSVNRGLSPIPFDPNDR